MTITVMTTQGDIEFVHRLSSGGEINPNIKDVGHWRFADQCDIRADLRDPSDVMSLLLVTDALRRRFGHKLIINLIMPYVPYARQDRVCTPGDAFGAKVFCDLINAQNYDSVTIWDAHSDVVPALLHRCTNVHCSEFVGDFASRQWVMVAPDASAAKEKVPTCARESMCSMITAIKHRDVKTGKVSGTTIVDDEAWKYVKDEPGLTLLLIDDICDRGATFIDLARLLRASMPSPPFIKLYVTHGIFADGLSPFAGLIDEVITPNPWPNFMEHARVKFTHLKP